MQIRFGAWLGMVVACGLWTACDDGGTTEGSPEDTVDADSPSGEQSDVGGTVESDATAAGENDAQAQADTGGSVEPDPDPDPDPDPGAEIEDPAAYTAVDEDGSGGAMVALIGALETSLHVDDNDGLAPKLGGGACPEIYSTPGDLNGWTLDYGRFGCVNARGKFLRGLIRLDRVRSEGVQRNLQIQFEHHRRGMTARSPVLNGAIRVTREEAKTYRVENDPDERLEVRIAGRTYAADLNTVTFELRRKIEVYAVATFTDTHDADRVRVVETRTAEGTEAPLVYPLRTGDGCGCPEQGVLRVSGTGFLGNHEGSVTLHYDSDGPGSRAVCGPTEVHMTIDGEAMAPIDAQHPTGVSDLQTLRVLCLGDRARQYDCLPAEDERGGACEAVKGLYQMVPGEARFKVRDWSLMPERLPDGRDVPHGLRNYVAGSMGLTPLDMCSEMVGSMADRLASAAMTVRVAGNCAAGVYMQPWAKRDGGGPIKGICGRFLDLGNGDWDFVQERLGMGAEERGGLKRLFFGERGSDEDSAIGRYDTGEGKLTIELSNLLQARNGTGDDAKVFDTAAECVRGRSAETSARMGFRQCLSTHPWSGSDGVWDYLTTLSACAGQDLRDLLAQRIARLDGEARDDRIRIGDAILDMGLLARLRLLMLNSDDADKALSASFPAERQIADKIQDYVFTLVKARADCAESPCLPVPSEREAVWPDPAYKADGMFLAANLPEPKRTGRRLWVLVNGRANVHMPTLEDIHQGCVEYADACRDVVANQALQAMSVYLTRPNCDMVRDFCDRLGALAANPGGFDWTAEVGDVEFDPSQCYPNVEIDPDDPNGPGSGRLCLLTALRRLYNHLPAWMYGADGQRRDDLTYDFARAMLFDTTPDAAVPDDLEVRVVYPDDNGQAVDRTLTPNPVRNALSQWFESKMMDKMMRVAQMDADPIATYGLSSESDGATFKWSPERDYNFRVAGATDYPMFLDDAATVESPRELNVCHPKNIILDNFFFPTIRWDGYYRTDQWRDLAHWLTQERQNVARTIGDPAADGYVNFWEATGAHAAEYIDATRQNNGRLKTATVFLTTSNLADIDGRWWGVRCPMCSDFTDLNDLRVVPDMGLFTETYMGWFDLAPSGRDYMRSPQPIIDYMVHVVVSRSNRKYVDATELYGGWVDPALADDGAIVLSVDVEYKPIIVINSDLFPGGNFTHFWRRDIYGALMQNPCQ